MQAFAILLLIALTGCSAGNLPRTGSAGNVAAAEATGPVGTFSGDVVKVKLEPNGIYVAEDIGPPEFWTMMEDNRAFLQRIKFPPQTGHWTWERKSGELRLRPENIKSFRWGIERLQFDSEHPDRLKWGDCAFLKRQGE